MAMGTGRGRGYYLHPLPITSYPIPIPDPIPNGDLFFSSISDPNGERGSKTGIRGFGKKKMTKWRWNHSESCCFIANRAQVSSPRNRYFVLCIFLS
ncbi:hypothetical protein RHMOL_Rhmol07G0096800 [Rhododendron molle]|uniref:Uncharacterized protein n=1 Tax=Rhododendron molle TaxID=49168 RepID=A0ACC0MZW7_RHOML|nr:hypothetical protein RHMOL_Rhmol07G0096800 [Rhododendron molle]